MLGGKDIGVGGRREALAAANDAAWGGRGGINNAVRGGNTPYVHGGVMHRMGTWEKY